MGNLFTGFEKLPVRFNPNGILHLFDDSKATLGGGKTPALILSGFRPFEPAPRTRGADRVAKGVIITRADLKAVVVGVDDDVGRGRSALMPRGQQPGVFLLKLLKQLPAGTPPRPAVCRQNHQRGGDDEEVGCHRAHKHHRAHKKRPKKKRSE